MKKTLAAVAVLGAFAGSALAADVTLYGVVDTGFAYNHYDADVPGVANKDTFSMESGQQSGSRWGLKGTEDLGNGLTVGFILESQFSGDDGQLHKDGFFRRESSLFLQGDFGKVAFGRMGSINNGTSSWGKIGALSAFGTSWGIAAEACTIFSCDGVRNNMISYETPSFAGFKAFAQYSMGSNDYENESGSDRYYALGATYNNGPLALYAAVDSVNYKSTGADRDVDDSLTVTLGGNYNFDVAKIYFGAQYFDEAKLSSIGGIATNKNVLGNLAKYYGVLTVNGEADTDAFKAIHIEGYGLSVSADIPLAGGVAKAGLGYVDAETTADSDADLTRWVVSVGYDYALSKRTNVYGVASYIQDKIEYGEKDSTPSATTVMVGLRHKF